MPRLIDANEILKSEHQHYDYMADEYYVLVRDIENAPTVDAEPVKHGHWNEAKDGVLWCSVCISDAPYVEDSWGYVIHAPHYDYCPNCGAKMDEVTEDAETD